MKQRGSEIEVPRWVGRFKANPGFEMAKRIGNALFQEIGRTQRDVRLRVAVRHADKASAERLPREVTALYTCGPAGGGGVRTALRPRLGTVSCLVPRDNVPASHRFIGEAA